MTIRLGGYLIELPFTLYDLLAVALLTGLWFAAIFALRMGLAFLELLPQLDDLTENYPLSPRVQLLTWHPVWTSLMPAVILGPITHHVITGATILRIYEATQPEEPEIAEEMEEENAA